MKDIKTSYGGETAPVTGVDLAGSKLVGVVVRNKGDRARRVTLMTNDTEVTLGKDVHYADYSYVDEKVKTIPPESGFNTARELELTEARVYHPIFTIHYPFSIPEFYSSVTGDKLALGQMSNAIAGLPATELSFDNAFTANEMRDRQVIGNPYISFSIRVKGKVSNIALDISKHPARVTADLNYYLGLLHPHLKGFFEINGTQGKFFFATDSDVGTVGFPYVNIAGEKILEVRSDAPYRFTNARHLNNGIEWTLSPNALPDNSSGNPPLTTYHEDTPANMVDLFAAAAKIRNSSITFLGGERYRATYTIPANEFKPFALDPRYYIKLVGINNQDGSNQVAWALKQIQYQDTSGVFSPAELLPVAANYNGAGGTTFLINKRLSLEAGFLTSDLFDEADKDIMIGESGHLTAELATKYSLTQPGEYYVAILAPALDNTQSAPMFRKPTEAVKIALEFERDEGVSQVITTDVKRSYKYEDVAYGLNYDLSFDQITGQFNGDMVLGLNLELFPEAFKATNLDYNKGQNTIGFKTPGLNFTKIFEELGYGASFYYTGRLEFMHRSKNRMGGYLGGYTGQILMEYPSTNYYFPTGETTVYVRERPDLDLAIPFDLVGTIQGGLKDRPWEFATSVEWEFQIDDQPVLIPLNATKLPGAANLTKNWSVGLNRVDFEALIDDAHVIKITVKAKFPWLAQPVTYKGSVALNVRKYIPPEEGLIAEESSLAIMLPKNVTGYTVRDADTDAILIDVDNALVNGSEDDGVNGDEEGAGDIPATISAAVTVRVYEDQWYMPS